MRNISVIQIRAGMALLALVACTAPARANDAEAKWRADVAEWDRAEARLGKVGGSVLRIKMGGVVAELAPYKITKELLAHKCMPRVSSHSMMALRGMIGTDFYTLLAFQKALYTALNGELSGQENVTNIINLFNNSSENSCIGYSIYVSNSNCSDADLEGVIGDIVALNRIVTRRIKDDPSLLGVIMLQLRYTKVSGTCFRHLGFRELLRLKAIDLGHTPITDDGFASLRRLWSDKKSDIDMLIFDNDKLSISTIDDLSADFGGRRLSLSLARVTITGGRSGGGRVASTDWLARLCFYGPHLENLDLSGCDIDDDGLLIIQSLRGPRWRLTAERRFSLVPNGRACALQFGCAVYAGLRFRSIQLGENAAITDKGIAHLRDMVDYKTEIIDINGTKVSGVGLSDLLYFSSNSSDNVPSLTSLSVSGTRVFRAREGEKDNSSEAIGRIRTLVALDVSKTNISDFDLQYILYNNFKIENLNVSATRVTDRGLLGTVPTKVPINIIATDTKVTPAAINFL